MGNSPKRKRGEQDGYRLARVKHGPVFGGYLSCFDESKPITVIVTPRRKTQGTILSRNLRGEGAFLIDIDGEHAAEAGIVEDTDLLVVTDEKSKAEARLAAKKLKPRSTQFVSTKWASSVLSAERWLPVSSYLLGGSGRVREITTSSVVEQCDVIRSENTSSLPVWCSCNHDKLNDVAGRRDFFQHLPSFLCQRSTITQAIYAAPNKDVCDILEKLAQKRVLEKAGGSEATADIRARAYRIASATLKCVPFRVQTVHDVDSLHSLGPRVLAVLNEYLVSGKVAEADLLESDPRLRTLGRFREMYGIGPVSARDMYDVRKIKSVSQLRERISRDPTSFSEMLVKYMRHYDELLPTTVETGISVMKFVEEAANGTGIRDDSLNLRFMLCGGFRRGEPTGHDIDLLYCRRRAFEDSHISVLDKLVERLMQRRIVVEVLRKHSDVDGWGEVHYHQHSVKTIYPYGHDILHAVAQLNGKKFRLDIVGIRDAQEFCFATLAWSGSTAFQRDLRQLCEKRHDWIFNQHGVFHRDSGRRVELQPQPRTEHDVFAAMGLTYRPPFERSA